MNSPTFYLMTPAMSGAVEVIMVHHNHNLNVLLNFQRRKPWLSFLSCSADEAFKALNDPNNDAIGVGCYIPCEDAAENKFRKLASRVKSHTFGSFAKGWHIQAPEPLKLTPVRERKQKELLRLFN